VVAAIGSAVKGLQMVNHTQYWNGMESAAFATLDIAAIAALALGMRWGSEIAQFALFINGITGLAVYSAAFIIIDPAAVLYSPTRGYGMALTGACILGLIWLRWSKAAKPWRTQ